MSKSSSLNRSSSNETEHDPEKENSKDPSTASIVEEDDKNTSIRDEQEPDISAQDLRTYFNREMMPASPPPSYEFVLKETSLKKQESDQSQSPTTPTPITEIIHTSSKEFYKAVAKQFGVTCKMSDQCRCYDCQSNYFDCEYDENEQEKTDGGLGAGTPMFLHEVMHESACTIL